MNSTWADKIARMERTRSQPVFVYIIIFWFLFFFRPWLAFSATKFREWQQMVGRSREQQLQILHPTGELTQLLQLKTLLEQQTTYRQIVVFAPQRDQQLPQGHNASILRAVLYPFFVSADQEILDTADLIAVIIASPSTFEAKETWCLSGDEHCDCWENKQKDQEVLCWHMPTP